MTSASPRRYAVGLLSTHPIQYHTPWYRALARLVDLEVFYCHQQTGDGQAAAGFGVAFEWDVPLLDGYRHTFLANRARRPGVSHFAGCDTPQIAALIAGRHYDAFIVPGWYVKSYIQAILACKRAGVPVLVRGDSHLGTRRSAAKRAAKQIVFRALIPQFDGYLVVGEAARRYYRAYGAAERAMFFAPHAVDNQLFAERAAAARNGRDELRAGWALPVDGPVCLFAGKFIAKKRPEDFVDAIALLNRQGQRIAGLMVGDGPLRPALEERARRERLPISFAGFLNQSAIPRAYAAADMLVLPSDGGETWGLVVNEAMASGIPAVVSDAVGCAPDLVLPGRTGATFPCGSPEALAATLGELLAAPGRVKMMGHLAQRHIQRYAVPIAAEGTLAAVRAVARRNRRR